MATYKTSDVILLSLVAGLAGAGMALLLAPRSGRETRQKIHDKTDDLKQQASENIDRAKLKMQHNTEKLKAWKDHLAKKAVEKGEEATDKLDQATNFDTPTLREWEEEV